MKILIFAGGAGTRFWPISRKSLPKQFIKMFDGKSTLELAVDRVKNAFGIENVYVCTNDTYVSLVRELIPEIPETNVFGEPEKRDLAPAIGYAFIRLKKAGYSGPVAILWADHLMENADNFLEILKKGKELVISNPEQLVFVGEKPRYAENNLGWIHLGKELDNGAFEFIEWHYKPPIEKCKEMFASKEWVWNPGYFIVDLENVLNLYRKHAPNICKGLTKIYAAMGTPEELATVNEVYPKLEKVSWDNGIVEKVPSSSAVVLKADMNWADPGTLYALKEALLGKTKQNLEEGLVQTYETEDCVVINKENGKLLTTVGLNGIVVVNTKDAILVVHKEKVREVSKLVSILEENPDLAKFV